MTARFRRVLAVATIATACGPESAPAPAEFEEICGAEGPHRLLELDAEQRMLAWGVRRIGERLYYFVGTGEGEPIFGFPQPATSTVHATGLCGEDPVVVADDVWQVFEHPRYPGALFGCRGGWGGDLVVLDPSGASEPRLLAADACYASWTDHGLVRFAQTDEETAQVLLYPFPADLAGGPIEPIVLLEAVRFGASSFGGSIFADEVLALDLADNIVRVSLPGGDVSIEQSGVLGFEATERWLLWQDLASADDEPEDPTADILLRDRESGDDMFLARRRFGHNYPQLSDRRVLMITAEHRETLLVELPALEVIAVPDGQHPRGRLDDGRWLTEVGYAGPWHLLDRDGTTTLVTADTGVPGWGPEELTLLRIPESPQAGAPAEGELWQYPFDGGKPELLARRANIGRLTLPDRGVVTTVGVDAQWVGRLVAVERETLAERELDDRVHGRVGLLDRDGDLEPDALVYTVVDGVRSGVWTAWPAAQQ